MQGQPLSIDVIVPRDRPRGWQHLLIRRLLAEGHDLAVLHDPAARPWPASANALLALERTVFRRKEAGLAAPLGAIAQSARPRIPHLRLDLAGNAGLSGVSTITLRFDRSCDDLAGVAAVAAGRLPLLEAVLDGRTVIGRALPMIDRQEATALGVEDMLARAMTLLTAAVQAFAEGRLADLGAASQEGGGTGFAGSYITRALPRLGCEVLRRACFRQAHWRVGYRFQDGPGVAQEGRLGTGWQILPDAGDRFYADPFPFHWQGRPYLFVEDYVHAVGKAVISVVLFDADGRAQAPRVVLEEPHHLSYPQVFERDGAVWMLPEASASGRLTLYRAVDFPDRWSAEATLLEGEISDATLLEHGGRLWLFATSRDGFAIRWRSSRHRRLQAPGGRMGPTPSSSTGGGRGRAAHSSGTLRETSSCRCRTARSAMAAGSACRRCWRWTTARSSSGSRVRSSRTATGPIRAFTRSIARDRWR